MEPIPGIEPKSEVGAMFWLIVKIALVIFIVFLGIKFLSEKKSPVDSGEEGFVEQKKTKTKTQKEKL